MKISNKMNKRYTLISIYVIITASIIYILSLLTKNAPFFLTIILYGLNWLLGVAKPIAIAFVFAYLLDPIVNFFENQFEKVEIKKWKLKSCRTLAVISTVFIFLAIIVLIISILVYNVTNQLRLANLDDLFSLSQHILNSSNEFYTSILHRLHDLTIKSGPVHDYVLDTGT